MRVRHRQHHDHGLYARIPAGFNERGEPFDILRPVVRRGDFIDIVLPLCLLRAQAHVRAVFAVVAAGCVIERCLALENSDGGLPAPKQGAGIDVDAVVEAQETLHVRKPLTPGVEARNGDLVALGVVMLVRAGEGVVRDLDIYDFEGITCEFLLKKVVFRVHGKDAAGEVVAAAVKARVKDGGHEAVPGVGGADHNPVETSREGGAHPAVHDGQGLRAVVDTEAHGREKGEGQHKAHG